MNWDSIIIAGLLIAFVIVIAGGSARSKRQGKQNVPKPDRF